MKKHFFLILITFLFFGAITFGQSVPEIPHIEVTGTAEMEIIPDELFLTITLKERVEGKDKISVETQEASLKKAVTDANIALANLVLADASASYTKLRWKKDVVTQAQYVLKLSSATEVAKMYEKLNALKIEDAYLSKVSHSKIEEYKKETRIMAIKAAKGKADYLLQAIGEEAGKPLLIQEVTQPDFYNNYNFRNANIAQVAYEAPSPNSAEIDFQKIKLSSSIYVKFAIK
jgi:uncharacterized protein